jgi:hypothetical protein
MKDFRVGEIEIPSDYFKLTQTQKNNLCSELMDIMITIIDKHFRQGIDRLDILDFMLLSSIKTNINEENYEVCAVLNDIRKILNEERI